MAISLWQLAVDRGAASVFQPLPDGNKLSDLHVRAGEEALEGYLESAAMFRAVKLVGHCLTVGLQTFVLVGGTWMDGLVGN